MKFPEIKKFSSVSSYFEEIYTLNKKLNKNKFSHRFFARKLNWPSSYLLDIIKKRKKITLLRSLQFIEAFKLSPSEAEYFINLGLAESEDVNVSHFFKDKIKNRDISDALKTPFDQYLVFIKNMPAVYLRELIIWGQGQKPIEDLLKLQIAFPELLDDQFLNQTLDFLINKKLIKEKSPNIYVVDKDVKDLLALDDGSFFANNSHILADMHIHSLDSLIRLYKNDVFNKQKNNVITFSSYLDIADDRVQEVKQKLCELREILVSYTREKKPSEANKTKCFQFEMHFVPMFNTSSE